MLKVAVHDLGDEVILRCQGRIVHGDETSLLCAAVRQYGRAVALDLSDVEAIDAAGIGVLISLQAAGIYLRLLNPRREVRDVLKLTRLASVFDIREASLPAMEAMAVSDARAETPALEGC